MRSLQQATGDPALGVYRCSRGSDFFHYGHRDSGWIHRTDRPEPPTRSAPELGKRGSG
jgi:hypothetical protein